MDLADFINQPLSLHRRPFQFFEPGEVPHDMMAWMVEHGTEIELGVLTGVIAGLILRGADPVACARYSIDGSVELPFQGCEDRILETIFAGMIERGHTPRRVAQLVEITCIASENAIEYLFAPSAVVAAKERARA